MPRQERSRQTVQTILQAAIHIFEQHGYAAGTTARIAERAGVSIGSLYQYFPSKDAILTALALEHLAEGLRLSGEMLAIAATPELALRPMLRQVVARMLALHRLNPVLHRLLHDEGLLPDELRRQLHSAQEQATAQLAQVLARRADVRRAAPHVLAYFVVHTIEHFTHRLVIEPPDGTVCAAGEEELVYMLEQYLRVQHVE